MGGRICILAGQGRLATIAEQAARARGDDVLLLPLVTEAGATPVFDLSHPGRIVAAIKQFGATHVVMAGAVTLAQADRSSLSQFAGGGAIPTGDVALSRLATALQAMTGAVLVGVHEIAPDLVAEAGHLAGPAPDPAADGQVAFALATARAIGALDIGQAAVTCGSRVIAVEDIAGTDALLQRVATYAASGMASALTAPLVLAKAAKPGQPRFVDLPAIGSTTIAKANAAGVSIVAVEAGSTLLIDRTAIVAEADRTGVCLVGAAHPDG